MRLVGSCIRAFIVRCCQSQEDVAGGMLALGRIFKKRALRLRMTILSKTKAHGRSTKEVNTVNQQIEVTSQTAHIHLTASTQIKLELVARKTEANLR